MLEKNIHNAKRKLFFDCETTGLPENMKAPFTDTDNWPRIVQLSWIIQNEDNGHYSHAAEFDFIVQPVDHIIPPEATKVHGISQADAEKLGMPLSYVLALFANSVTISDLIIAHNINFDLPIVMCEMYRKNMNYSILTKDSYCTMLDSTSLLKLPGKRGHKWPRLQELYYYLFNKEFDGAHNSLNDVRALKRCYYKLCKLKPWQEEKK